MMMFSRIQVTSLWIVILWTTLNLQADCFTIIRTAHLKKLSTTTSSSPISLFSFLKNSNDEDNENNNSFEGFNPFEKKKSMALNPLISSNTSISLRQLRMNELMNTLLQNVSIDDDNNGDDDENSNKSLLISILDKNSELLLEPLVDDNAMMDEDSIYEPGMSRDERFIRYDEVMEQRIQKATKLSVRKILSVMREYVYEQR